MAMQIIPPALNGWIEDIMEFFETRYWLKIITN